MTGEEFDEDDDDDDDAHEMNVDVPENHHHMHTVISARCEQHGKFNTRIQNISHFIGFFLLQSSISHLKYALRQLRCIFQIQFNLKMFQ